MTTRAVIRGEIQTIIGSPAQIAAADIDTLITSVHLEILNEHQWPHTRRDEIVNTVTDRTGTDGGFANGSAVVTSASAATGDDPEHFLRRSGDTDFWRIIAVTNGVSWTLEQPWPKATAASQTWTLFQRFYTVPSSATHNTLEILDIAVDDRFLPERSLDWLNHADPDRTETGEPIVWVPSPAGVISEVPHFELWPRLTAATPLRVWWKEAPILSSDSSLVEYPYRLAVVRGAMRACQYLHGRMEDTRWMILYQSLAQEYPAILSTAKRASSRIHGRFRKVRHVRSPGNDTGLLGTDFGVNRGIIW